MANKYERRFYPESKFGGFTDRDGTMAFYTRINALLAPTAIVLDLGCGRGSFGDELCGFKKNLRILKGKAAKVIGLDVDPNAAGNPFLDEFRLIERGEKWPVDDSSIDLIVCDNVLEHIADPDAFFCEIIRSLKNGGVLCMRTPNSWNYIALAARIIPNRHHAKIVAFTQNGRKEEDVFPTIYRCNNIWKLNRMLRKHGLEERAVYGYEAEPSYLSFCWFIYGLGVLHQKFAPSFLKAALFVFARKG